MDFDICRFQAHQIARIIRVEDLESDMKMRAEQENTATRFVSRTFPGVGLLEWIF